MNLIKFNTINSTSDFLKDLSKNQTLENFTTVVANAQTKGRGQMDAVWLANAGENLLFTIYVNLKGLSLSSVPYLNFLVAETLRKVLCFFLENDKGVKVKWPNDIMSYNSKMAGVLIETTLKKDTLEHVFIGIGLNVNQTEFPSFLRKATSMKLIDGKTFNLSELLNAYIKELKKVLTLTYLQNHKKEIKQNYLLNLYKLNTPAMFKDKEGDVFMGKIVDVNSQGFLILEKEDEKHYTYQVKEISLV